MPRENKYSAIVLKKQAFGEADELVTFYTQEAGKLRALAKAVKQPSSKLSYALQPAFLLSVTLAGNTLPKVIHTEILQTNSRLRDHADRISFWYVACELVLKATGDEQKNETVFALLLGYLQLLNEENLAEYALASGLAKFKLELLASLGLGLWFPEDEPPATFFSNSRGGFFRNKIDADAVPVNAKDWQSFLNLKQKPMSKLAADPIRVSEPLQNLISGFIEYQLDRQLKSEQFLEKP